MQCLGNVGPDRLDINIVQQMKDRGKHTTELSPEHGMKGNNGYVVAKESVFCFPYLLFQATFSCPVFAQDKGIYGPRV